MGAVQGSGQEPMTNPKYDHENPPKGARIADFEAPPNEVLDAVDEQLRLIGYKIVMYDTGGDEFAWTIQIRSKRS